MAHNREVPFVHDPFNFQVLFDAMKKILICRVLLDIGNRHGLGKSLKCLAKILVAFWFLPHVSCFKQFSL